MVHFIIGVLLFNNGAPELVPHLGVDAPTSMLHFTISAPKVVMLFGLGTLVFFF